MLLVTFDINDILMIFTNMISVTYMNSSCVMSWKHMFTVHVAELVIEIHI